MGTTKKIAMCGWGLCSWGGGIDFLKAYIPALSHIKGQELFLILPRRTNFGQILLTIKGFFTRTKNISMRPIKEDEIQAEFLAMGVKILTINYTLGRYVKKCVERCLRKNNIDVIFPTTLNYGKDFEIPWIPYVPDFQHKYYPAFFSEEECKVRDVFFDKILQDAKVVVVESEDTKKDIVKFYPDTTAEIIVMPYTAIPDKEWFNLETIDIEKYNLSRKYFIVSNQFWIHKAHLIAIKALAMLRSRGYDVDLVCTGKTDDYRDSNYFNKIKVETNKLGIENNVHFLGYIPKLEQIKLLKNSISAIQPTLFEGNPGGGIAYNAISLGIPIILSDIPVNLELDSEFAVFFKTNDVNDLAEKMENMILNKIKFPVYCEAELVLQGKQRLERLSDAVERAINISLNSKI